MPYLVVGNRPVVIRRNNRLGINDDLTTGRATGIGQHGAGCGIDDGLRGLALLSGANTYP